MIWRYLLLSLFALSLAACGPSIRSNGQCKDYKPLDFCDSLTWTSETMTQVCLQSDDGCCQCACMPLDRDTPRDEC